MPKLIVIGTGIKLGQLTLEAQHAVVSSAIVFAAMANKASLAMLRSFNPNVVDLAQFYDYGKDRGQTYSEMAEAVLEALRAGSSVCMAFYGHPCVYVRPSRDAVRMAREEGFDTEIFPGISAEASLFADLELDPAEFGCQSYEATSFLRIRPPVNNRAPLILWQIGVVGETQCLSEYSMPGFERVVEYLGTIYGSDGRVIVYEASEFSFLPSKICRSTIESVKREDFSEKSTLVILPSSEPSLAATKQDANLHLA